MIKRTPSRNHRSKGIKLKNVLQIILLLGVCFWLIYQIKHSHDKKKEFDENDAKEAVRMQNADQIPKLGRKDLQPLKDDIIQSEQHDEKEEDENNLDDEGNLHEHEEQEGGGSKHESGENLDKHEFRERDEEEESKHGAEERDEEENKSEESEDDGRGGGDEEIEENDQEKPEVDIDRDEELMDEDREREKEESDEKENEDGEDEEKDSSVEDKSTHEAREEHYMADDASSAVAHDALTTSTESVILSAENSNENSEMSIVKQENKPNYTEVSGVNQNDSGKITADEMESGNVSNATGKESGDTILSNSVSNPNVNTTATANSDGHLEVSSNHSVAITEAINNSTGDGINTAGSSEQNKTVILSESESSQNTTVDMTANDGIKNGKTEELEQSHGDREDNLPITNSTISMKTGNAGESSNSGAGQSDKTINHVASNETQNNSVNSDAKENIDASVDEMSKVQSEMAATNVTQNSSDAEENNDARKDEKSMDDPQLDSTHRTSDSSSVNGGDSDLVEQDAIDVSDSHIHKDVTEVQTDLDTLPDIRDDEANILDEHALPDIRNAGNILDETAAE
ncbi:cilia- and flagella-associated protein 251-like isoform X2 [Neltuma alba]|nr:cilia- and flagella-associated protein 251-like isoform X2 [Prosopis alba]